MHVGSLRGGASAESSTGRGRRLVARWGLRGLASLWSWGVPMAVAVVTGASGFVGRHLVSRLCEAGIDVVGVTHSRDPQLMQAAGIKWLSSDLEQDYVALSQVAKTAGFVFHCAGIASRSTRPFAANVAMTRNVVRALDGSPARLVLLSSVGVYGLPDLPLVDESARRNPVGEYEMSKSQCEDEVQRMAHDWVIVRPSIVIGEDMPNRSLRGLVGAIHSGLFFYPGDSSGRMNYVHVDDVAGALVALATNRNTGGIAFNVSQSCSLQELVTVVQKTLGVRHAVSTIPMWLGRIAARTGDVFPGFPFTSSRLNALTCTHRYSDVQLKEVGGWTFPMILPDRVSRVVQGWYA
jgi:nucleoside-diphosphate-sugar epimerase